MNTQRHKYDYAVSPHAAGAKVQRMVGTGKHVLELGSGPGAITKLLTANGCHVTALEMDDDAIELVKPHCERVIACNLDDPEWPTVLEGEAGFDTIVAADVLEHLRDPWRTLQQVKSLLGANGRVVVSLPHIAHGAILAGLLDERFQYQPWGLLDRTHVRFFGLRDVQDLFANAGFKIIDVDFVVKTPEQTEFAAHWQNLSDDARHVISGNAYGNVYQVVVTATPIDAPGHSIDLLTVPVSEPSPGDYRMGSSGTRLKRRFLSFLSLGSLRRLLARVAPRPRA